MEVVSYTRKIFYNFDSKPGKQRLRTNSRKLQKAGATRSPGSENDLSTCIDRMSSLTIVPTYILSNPKLLLEHSHFSLPEVQLYSPRPQSLAYSSCQSLSWKPTAQ